MGWMLSPLSLATLGNGVGGLGSVFFPALLGWVSLSLVVAFYYGRLSGSLSGSGSEASLLERILGRTLATVLPLSARLVTAVCAMTLILATAGYVFNEVFVLWFPNLAFSFCLLILLALLQGAPYGVRAGMQVIFVMSALLGLSLLIVQGLLAFPQHLPQSSPITAEEAFSPWRYLFGGIAVFMGFELGGSGRRPGKHALRASSVILPPILMGAVFLGLWGWVSYLYVSPDRLAESTVPYSAVARGIWGETGRRIMAGVILAGSCACVNALLQGVTHMMVSWSQEGFLPALLRGRWLRLPVSLFLLAGSVGAMLLSGMAGEPETFTYTRAGIILWWLTYGAVLLAQGVRPEEALHPDTGLNRASAACGGIVALGGAVGLLIWDPERWTVLLFLGVVLAIGLLCHAVRVHMLRPKSDPY
jgi:hypothetical protein